MKKKNDNRLELKFKDCNTSREHELTQYLQNPEKTAAPKEILQASKPSGHVAYVCKVDLADIILSAETRQRWRTD